MITSANDKKLYRHITLENGLSALLISQPDATKSAASLAVNVGHFNDPSDREGLAHLLEHMMFLGTDKYPDPSEYQRYIKQHGGEHNAWTGSEFTNFYFAIDSDYFMTALDRFSDFFIAPKLCGEMIAKERAAVDSEFQLKYQDDSRRLSAVLKETVNAAHPYSQFSVGNNETLAGSGEDLEQVLREFYHSQYCASKMKLVLLCNQELDIIEKSCRQYFSQITNRQLTCDFGDVPLYLNEQYSVEINVVPTKDTKKLTLSFELDIDDINYYCKPLSYLAFLIGHEGEGSLLSSLKKAGLANNLSAGTGLSGYNFREFAIHIALTELGARSTDRIIGLVFQMLRMIETQGIDAWRYTEKHNIMNVAFDFQEPPKAVDLVSHLSINMFKYEEQDIVYGDYAMDSFEPEAILRLVASMNPDTVRLVMVCPQLATTKTAKWYDTPYDVLPISSQRRKLWTLTSIDNELALPQPNPFVVERLAFTPPQTIQDKPSILLDEAGFRLWHLPQSEFTVPKGHIYTAIDSPIVDNTPQQQVLCRLYIEMLHDSLAQVTFPAEIAGMHYDIYPHASGVTMHVSGYTPKLFLFFEILITKIRERDFTPQRFEEIKYQLTKSWRDQRKAKPINRLFKGLSATLQPHQFDHPQLIEELANITLDDLQQFVSALFKHVHLESFVLGDWPTREVKLFGASLHRQIDAIADAAPSIPRQVHSLANCGTLVRQFEQTQDQSAVIVYYQSQDNSPSQVALWSLASQILSPLFFSEIRTNQQLGYVCGASYMPINRYPGMMLYVQSSVANTNEILGAIDNVLSEFAEYVEDIDETRWQRYLNGMKSQIDNKDSSARQQATRFWTGICNRDLSFSHRNKTLEALAFITPQALISFIEQRLISPSPDRLIMMTGDDLENSATDYRTINDMTEFKAQTPVMLLTPN
ncbi:MAG: insulinase family protein [Psychrobium sp.]